MADCVIWGSAGHARVLRDILAARGDRIVALIDRDPAAESVAEGVPVLAAETGLEELLAARAPDTLAGYVAIGGARGADRRAVLDRFAAKGIATPPLLHPAAQVAASARVAAGAQALAGAVVAADAWLGRGVIVNHRAGVDHECRLGDGVHVAPGATLCGCVTLESDVFVGAGAIVLPRLHIGAGAVIGAGATVTRDVGPGETVVGTPARVPGSAKEAG